MSLFGVKITKIKFVRSQFSSPILMVLPKTMVGERFTLYAFMILWEANKRIVEIVA